MADIKVRVGRLCEKPYTVSKQRAQKKNRQIPIKLISKKQQRFFEKTITLANSNFLCLFEAMKGSLSISLALNEADNDHHLKLKHAVSGKKFGVVGNNCI